MKRRLIRVFIALVLLGFIGAIATWLYVFKESDSNVASRKADVEISARDLVARFEENESLANSNFLDKVILVKGNIESVNEDSLGISVYLKNSDDIAGVICSFSKGDVDLKRIIPGHTINVKGLCTGYLMDVVLNKCAIID